MSPRALPLLRALVAVLIVAIVVVAAALVRQLVVGSGGAPRTELERAVAAAEEAVRGNPNDPQARVKLAAAYLEQGSANSAIKQAQNAIRLAPKDPSGYYILGLAEGKSGDSKSAVADLRKAGTMEGQQAGFYQDAYVALAHEQEKAGDLKGAKASLDKAIDYGPENALLLYERGAFAERQNDWYTAALDYGWALQYVPTYQVAQDGLARVKKDHPAEAKKAAADLSTDARFNAPAVSATGTK